MTRRMRGITLLEVAVVLVVVVLLAGILFTVLGRYQAMAEREMVELNVRNIQTGMRLEVAQLLLAGRQRELPGFVGVNPVRWLSGTLPDYLGERDEPLPAELRGCWYFDRSSKSLVYRPQSAGLTQGKQVELRWQVVLSGGLDSGVKLSETQIRH